MAYDPVRDRVVLSGGLQIPSTGTCPAQSQSEVIASMGNLLVCLMADTWEWDGGDWTEVAASGPPGRYGASAAYDPSSGTILVFGGIDSVSTQHFLDESWSWDGTTWTQLAPSKSPPARAQARLLTLASTREVLLMGGQGVCGSHCPGLWAWSDGNWALLPVSGGPTFSDNIAAAFDPSLRAIVAVASGSLVSGAGPDTWAFDGQTWATIISGAPPMSARYRAGAAYDPLRKLTVVFGGAV